MIFRIKHMTMGICFSLREWDFMKNIYKRFINNTGSMTVEASLIFPMIILVIVVVIYICILLYQYAYLQTVANHVAERGASCWDNISKMEIDCDNYRLKTGELKYSEELLKADLYWSNKAEKIKNLKMYTIHKLRKRNILRSEISKLNIDEVTNTKDKVDIWIKDYIVYKELNVIINDSYKIPLGDSLKIFGLDNKYNINVHSKAVINEPLEFIRNTDFIIDTLNEYEVTSEIINKFKETMEKIKDNINNLFDTV